MKMTREQFSAFHADNMRRCFLACLPEGFTLSEWDSLAETERQAWIAAFDYAFQLGAGAGANFGGKLDAVMAAMNDLKKSVDAAKRAKLAETILKTSVKGKGGAA